MFSVNKHINESNNLPNVINGLVKMIEENFMQLTRHENVLSSMFKYVRLLNNTKQIYMSCFAIKYETILSVHMPYIM